MKRLPLLAWLLTLPVLAGSLPAVAKTCAVDAVPAATLLLPYFEVDLTKPGGRTTLLAINNASDRATLAHVVLWTDLGVPTLAFDVYLTGYDIQTLNLRDVLAGRLPVTADNIRDPADTLSHQGDLSQDASFPGCAGLLPPVPLSAAMVEHLTRSHQGFSSPLLEGKCAAQALGDQVARG